MLRLRVWLIEEPAFTPAECLPGPVGRTEVDPGRSRWRPVAEGASADGVEVFQLIGGETGQAVAGLKLGVGGAGLDVLSGKEFFGLGLAHVDQPKRGRLLEPEECERAFR